MNGTYTVPFVGRLFKLAILLDQMPLHEEDTADGDSAEGAHDQHRREIARCVLVREEEWVCEISDEAEDIAKRNSRCTLLRGPPQSRRDPGHEQRVGGEAAANVEETGKVSDGVVQRSSRDNIADERNNQRRGHMPASFLSVVRRPGQEVGSDCGDKERGRGEEDCLHACAHVETADDAGIEVVPSVGV